MTTKIHTDIAFAASATSPVLNAPLGQLDSAIADIEALFGDYVVTGGLPGGSGTLTVTQPACRAFVLNSYIIMAATTLVMSASKDNYVDLDSAGVYHISPVTLGAGAPAVFANSIRLYKAVAAAGSVTSIVDLRPAAALHVSTLTVDAGATFTAGPLSFPAASIPQSAIIGGSGAGATINCGPATGVDDTAIVNNAIIEAMTTNPGGTVVLWDTQHDYVCLGALDFPYTGPAGGPVQNPIRITGPSGPTWNGYWSSSPIKGRPVLDLRYAGGDGIHVAKIDTRGAGFLEIDHLTLKSGGSDDYLFMQTTNTRVEIHHNGIVGNAAKSGTTCVQDFIKLGGSASLVVGNGSDAPFQGYGSKLHDNFYSNIRKVTVWGTYCNGIEVENDTISLTCGSSDAQGAPYEFAPAAGQACQGNRIRGGTVEIQNYKYAVNLKNDASGNTFDSITCYDDTGYTVGVIYCASATTTLYNTVIAGWAGYGIQPKYLDGPGAAVNTLISGQRDAPSRFPRGIGGTGVSQLLPFRNLPASGQFNFLLAANYNLGNAWELSPSTVADGSVWANKGLRMDNQGHLISAGGAPGAGTGLAANVTSITSAGTDQSGVLTIVISGGGTAAATVLGTVPFAGVFLQAANTVLLIDQTTGNVTTFKFTAQTIGAASFQIKAEQALAAGTYKVAYFAL